MPLRLLTITLAATLALTACGPARGGAEPRPLTYVAIGASDAVGVGARDPERESYVNRLAERLPPGSSVANLGVSGSRLDQAIQQQLPVAEGLRPDLVTVWLAVNDLNAMVPLERYTAELDALLGGLDETGATVLVGNVPDLALLPAYKSVDPKVLEAGVAAWDEAIAATVRKHGDVLVDLRALSREQAEHPEYVGADGFHPSTQGHMRLAELFLQALQANGGLGGRGG